MKPTPSRPERARTQLLYLVSHPIQYQAPLLRLIAREASFDLTVGFTTDAEESHFSKDFKMTVEYDVPLLDGYAWFRASYRRILTAIRSADVVWLHGWRGRKLLYALLVARIMRRPVLMRSETWSGAYSQPTSWRGRLRPHFHRVVLRACSGYLTVGAANRSYLLSLGCSAERMFHVPYAVDNHHFGGPDVSRAVTELRRDLGLEPTDRVILFCGKLTRRKLPDILLEAWRHTNWPSVRPVLVFAGDGELRGLVSEAAAADERVRFIGFVNQSALPALYACADVFVLASQREPFGLAINEAMASGTAVIASDEVGAAADLVDDDVGRVVPAGDVKALSKALVEVLQSSVEMGRASRQRMAGWGFAQDLQGLEKAVLSVQPRRR